ncbi:hypothetical protein [Marinisporobacter balticus]|uniref:Iron-dependent peroxidase n=1 Tax=Marinisporobacter balticus TaxID=2018667 RepID=A0A4R2KN61_9FIRM|nr:hypothetical protein [Marinisporobacter balticus]TCO71508.1 hypothetical protein EV214_12160 [Marinisporobacter balticus]
MNYIWDILFKADDQNIKREKIRFECAKNYSPYMEIAFEDLNTTEIDETLIVEINPYYRFFSIFKNLFDVNFDESMPLREVLLDISIHFLGNIDLKQGLSKQEYYKKYILQDIRNNIFSEEIKDNIKNFDKREKDILLSSMINLYTTGVSLELFKSVVNKIFEKSIVYTNQDNKKEILIYIGARQTQEIENKIQTLIELFLHIEFKVIIYWQYHFGILGIEDTMKIGKMVLY